MTTRPQEEKQEPQEISLVEVAGWPGTVSRDRMVRAANALVNDTPAASEQDQQDIDNMLLAVAMAVKGNDMVEELDAIAEGQERQALRRAHEMARMGDTKLSIGAIILRPAEGDENSVQLDVVTWIPRHHEWMGASTSHTLLKELTVKVYESETFVNQPGMYLAMPNHEQLLKPGDTPFPEGEATQLRAIALWHGAKECIWHPKDDGGGTRDRRPTPARPALV